MAAPYNPPKKNEDFIFEVCLEDYSNPGNFKNNPTIDAGDVRVMIDHGALANLATLPDVVPGGSPTVTSPIVRVQLSASEMNGDNITILFVDQTATKEWADLAISIPTTQ